MRAMLTLTLGLLATGCGPDQLTAPSTYEALQPLPNRAERWEAAVWTPATARSAPLRMTLHASQQWNVDAALASASGEHAIFVIDGQACTTTTSTGGMDTDTEVTPGDATDATIVDSVGEDPLVTTTQGVARVEMPISQTVGRGTVTWLSDAPAIDARLVGDDLWTMSRDCTMAWSLGEPVDLGDCGSHVAVVVGDEVLVASSDAVLVTSALGGTATWLDRAVDGLAADPVSGVIAVAEGATVLGLDGGAAGRWQTDLAGATAIDGVTDGGDLGLFAVDGWVDDDRVVWMIDAATGEPLGVFDVSETTRTVDVSGGSLLQVRPGNIDVWFLTR